MYSRITLSLSLAGALTLAAAGASATPVSLTYQGPTASDPKSVTITAAPVAYPGTGDWPKSVGAWGFEMVDGSGLLGSFVAWCLDVGSFLAPTSAGAQDYKITHDPFSNSYGLTEAERARVQKVFDANYATLDLSKGVQVAGFQLALWDAVYDNDWNLSTGAFKATASDAILTAASGFLGAAQGWQGGKAFNMTFLESTGSTKRQNLVTVAPVPVPAAGGLLLLALGGLALARRRRKAA